MVFISHSSYAQMYKSCAVSEKTKMFCFLLFCLTLGLDDAAYTYVSVFEETWQEHPYYSAEVYVNTTKVAHYKRVNSDNVIRVSSNETTDLKKVAEQFIDRFYNISQLLKKKNALDGRGKPTCLLEYMFDTKTTERPTAR